MVVEHVWFNLEFAEIPPSTLHGYLFLCPANGLECGPFSFQWPECPAYWSLDPSGVERLSTQDAENLGFPVIQWTTSITGNSWDAAVYASLRQFHQGKGFNPIGEDVARHLGEPLFQCSPELETSFEYGRSSVFNRLRFTL